MAWLLTVTLGVVTASATEPQKAFFDGEQFHNQAPFEDRSVFELIRWRLTRSAPEWPDWIESEPKKVPERRVAGDRLSVTYINHSSVLIQYHGVNILTDPTWNERASPSTIMGPRRVRNAGVNMEDLPEIDLVLISHNHYDHLDIQTLSALAERFDPTVLAGLRNKPLLEEAGLKKIHELDWWGTFAYKDLRITFTPTQHFSARGLFDKMETLWGGFVVESPTGNVYVGGDTGMGPHYAQLRDRFHEFRLALLPIGGYKPRWFMKATHTSPAETVQAHQILNAKLTIGIHFGTFAGLSDEGIDEPLKDLEAALKEAGVDETRFITLDFGETKSDL